MSTEFTLGFSRSDSAVYHVSRSPGNYSPEEDEPRPGVNALAPQRDLRMQKQDGSRSPRRPIGEHPRGSRGTSPSSSHSPKSTWKPSHVWEPASIDPSSPTLWDPMTAPRNPTWHHYDRPTPTWEFTPAPAPAPAPALPAEESPPPTHLASMGLLSPSDKYDEFLKSLSPLSSGSTPKEHQFVHERGNPGVDDEGFAEIMQMQMRLGPLPEDDADPYSRSNDASPRSPGVLSPRSPREDDYELFGRMEGMDPSVDPSLVDPSLESGSYGEHPYGEFPSTTLFVRNINSNVEDEELRPLFEAYGPIRSMYTPCKHRGFVMISYYDIRHAQAAMRYLQGRLVRRRKLDIHYSIPKSFPPPTSQSPPTSFLAPGAPPAPGYRRTSTPQSQVTPPPPIPRLPISWHGEAAAPSHAPRHTLYPHMPPSYADMPTSPRTSYNSNPGAVVGMLPQAPADKAARNRHRNTNEDKSRYELVLERVQRGEDPRTTLMIKNIPNKYTQKMLLSTVDERHRGHYDFFYLPIDFKNKCNVGYAFINFIQPESILAFYHEFNGRKWEKFNSEKVCVLSYARIQGKGALVSHFQNSSLMSEDKKCRPILFRSDGPNAGEQEPFPLGPNMRVRRLSNGSRSNNPPPSQLPKQPLNLAVGAPRYPVPRDRDSSVFSPV